MEEIHLYAAAGNLNEIISIVNNDATTLDRVIAAEELDALQGNTPLIFASFYGHVDVMTWLLEHGANINHQNQQGQSALMSAICRNHQAAVSLLLQRGADGR